MSAALCREKWHAGEASVESTAVLILWTLSPATTTCSPIPGSVGSAEKWCVPPPEDCLVGG